MDTKKPLINKPNCSKISKNIGVLFRARDKLQTNCLITLYNTLILPYLQYCIIVWGKTYQTAINKLLTLQKRIVRIITFSKYRANSSILFKRLNLLKVCNLYSYSCAVFMFKFRQGKLISLFDNWFICNNINHNYNTRFGYSYKSHMSLTKQSSFNIKTQGPTIWNAIPQDIITHRSISTFKRSLRKHLLLIQE